MNTNSNNQANRAPEFFENMKEEFIQKAIGIGLDFIDVKDLIEDKGLPEASHDLLLDIINNKNYVNKLKTVKVQPDPKQQQSYDYFDPSESKGKPNVFPSKKIINTMQMDS